MGYDANSQDWILSNWCCYCCYWFWWRVKRGIIPIENPWINLDNKFLFFFFINWQQGGFLTFMQSHTVLTKRDWQNIRIGDISLPQALRCWELQPYWSVSNHMTSHDVTGEVIAPLPPSDEENVASVHPLRHSHKRYKAANLESK